jgi:hypothetical protein
MNDIGAATSIGSLPTADGAVEPSAEVPLADTDLHTLNYMHICGARISPSVQLYNWCLPSW